MFDFEVIIDGSLVELGLSHGLDPSHNKWLLSILNDFEDGAWRQERFDNFIWDNIAETALSKQERELLRARPQSLLTAAAKNLRLTDAEVDFGKGSELAEIVLYGIMRHRYGALPVVPKIFYKQNVRDYAKGADSVHIVIDAKGEFSLWFGEAKFYKSIGDARLSTVVASVEHALDTAKLKKENSIITNLSELDQLGIDAQVRAEIRKVLVSTASMDAIKHRINIPILLLHECSITAGASEIIDEYVDEIRQFHRERAVAYFGAQIAALKKVFKYSDVRFHLILFPVPKKQPIVDRFLKSVEFHKN